MAATYVTKAELRLALGIGDLYNDSVVEEVCQAAENIIKGKLAFNKASVVAYSASGTTGTIYFNQLVTDRFYVGQTVTVDLVAQHFNGTQTLTVVNPYDVSFVNAQITTTPKHIIVPYGYALHAGQIDYATLPEVREASLMVAVDIWQARQASNAGGISPDFSPSPYRMGNTLMARVRGLIADYLAAGGLVG